MHPLLVVHRKNKADVHFVRGVAMLAINIFYKVDFNVGAPVGPSFFFILFVLLGVQTGLLKNIFRKVSYSFALLLPNPIKTFCPHVKYGRQRSISLWDKNLHLSIPSSAFFSIKYVMVKGSWIIFLWYSFQTGNFVRSHIFVTPLYTSFFKPRSALKIAAKNRRRRLTLVNYEVRLAVVCF